MAPYDVDKVLADTEYVLRNNNPSFDITDAERQIAREHAETMCTLLAMCDGNKFDFVKAMAGMVGTAQAFMQWAREYVGNDGGEFPDQAEVDDFHRQEKESAFDDFDKQFGAVWRKQQIQQAVCVACWILLKKEEGTVS